MFLLPILLSRVLGIPQSYTHNVLLEFFSPSYPQRAIVIDKEYVWVEQTQSMTLSKRLLLPLHLCSYESSIECHLNAMRRLVTQLQSVICLHEYKLCRLSNVYRFNPPKLREDEADNTDDDDAYFGELDYASAIPFSVLGQSIKVDCRSQAPHDARLHTLRFSVLLFIQLYAFPLDHYVNKDLP